MICAVERRGELAVGDLDVLDDPEDVGELQAHELDVHAIRQLEDLRLLLGGGGVDGGVRIGHAVNSWRTPDRPAAAFGRQMSRTLGKPSGTTVWMNEWDSREDRSSAETAMVASSGTCVPRSHRRHPMDARLIVERGRRGGGGRVFVAPGGRRSGSGRSGHRPQGAGRRRGPASTCSPCGGSRVGWSSATSIRPTWPRRSWPGRPARSSTEVVKESAGGRRRASSRATS